MVEGSFDVLQTEALAGGGATLRRSEQITCGSYPGREFVGDKGEGAVVIARVFVVGQDMYTVMAFTRMDPDAEQLGMAFVNSFRPRHEDAASDSAPPTSVKL
jgi:hypothetical protein